MNRLVPLSLALLLVALGVSSGSSSPPALGPEGALEYTIDGSHSTVLFRIKHLNVAWAYGRFNEVGGSFLLNEEYPEASSVEVKVRTASVDTANKDRDDHLRSPDFFSAKEFPTIHFESTEVQRSGDDWKVTGELSFHGVTKTITMQAQHVGSGPDLWGGERAGFEGVFKLDPRDYGVDWILKNEGALGTQVTLTVSLEGILQK